MKKWAIRQLVRLLHLSVCLAIMLPLLLRPSALHRMIFAGTNLVHGLLYVLCFVATLVAYLIASYTDPGYLTHEKARLFRHRRGNLSDISEDQEIRNEKYIPVEPDNAAEYRTLETRELGEDNQSKGVESFPTEVSELDIQTNASLPLSRRDLRSLFNPRSWLSCPFSSWFISTNIISADTAYEDFVLNLPVPVRFCKRCLLEQPLRCRHCPDCNRCVIKFDHHCPWLANCVGERNHSAFVVFLMLQTLVLWWTVYLAWSSIVPNYIWADWFRLNAFFLVEIVVLMVVGIPLTVLLGFHTYLALASKTTWETVAYERIVYLQQLDDRVNPFNQGLARNCFTFCCSRYPLGWDRIYAEAVEQMNAEKLNPNTFTQDVIPSELRLSDGDDSKPAGAVYVRLQPDAPPNNRILEEFEQLPAVIPSRLDLNAQICVVPPVICVVNSSGDVPERRA